MSGFEVPCFTLFYLSHAWHYLESQPSWCPTWPFCTYAFSASHFRTSFDSNTRTILDKRGLQLIWDDPFKNVFLKKYILKYIFLNIKIIKKYIKNIILKLKKFKIFKSRNANGPQWMGKLKKQNSTQAKLLIKLN